MRTEYEQYQSEILAKIESCKSNFNYQPILFIGSGFSKRYLNSPNWLELLENMSKICPNVKKDFAYYVQSKNNDLSAVASQFVGLFKNWAWAKNGKENFPKNLFNINTPEDVYLKYKVCEYFVNLLKDNEFYHSISDELKDELLNLQAMCPQSIITTNYDTFLENFVFTEHTPIVGQKIITNHLWDIGEIYKIHGCASDLNSIVLTKEDYEVFNEKSKYLIAKLMTFFVEHPIIFIGYGVNDDNIKKILSDIDLVLGTNGGLIPNMFFLKWERDFDENISYPREHTVILENGRSIRLNNISINDYNWVFKAFKNENTIDNFNPKILRALQARQYKLVREDIPKSIMPINYEVLNQYSDLNDNKIVNLYGIADASDVSSMGANYPYTLTQLANKLGYDSWYYANILIEKITNDKGVSIKTTDNIYHIKLKNLQLYSEMAFKLLEKVKNGEEYEVILE